MNIAIEVPDDLGKVLAGQSGGASRAVLEAVAVESYRTGALTQFQVRQMLGFESRWETETFLQRAKALNGYTAADLDGDIADLGRLFAK